MLKHQFRWWRVLCTLKKNLSESDERDTWYFQFAEDYATRGSILESSEPELRVCCLERSEVQDMFNVEELACELQNAAGRRAAIED